MKTSLSPLFNQFEQHSGKPQILFRETCRRRVSNYIYDSFFASPYLRPKIAVIVISESVQQKIISRTITRETSVTIKNFINERALDIVVSSANLFKK